MSKITHSPSPKYLLEVLAVGLVVAIASFLTSQLATGDLQAQTATVGHTISAELTNEQPLKLGQLPDQWVARYQLSTDSPSPVLVNSLDFYALGTLRFQFVRRPNLAPLSATIDNVVIGAGTEWVMSYGSIQQLVQLTPPVRISKDRPATVDIYVDLNKLSGYNFGVELEGITGSIPASGLPVPGRAYKIKTFL